jgi:hypothetical protein
MLIRLPNDTLIKYPDEIGALALANPRFAEVPDFSLEEVNLIINITLAANYDESMTLTENIEGAKKHCTKWGTPTAENLEKALVKIKNYNEQMPVEDIGYSDTDFLLDAYSSRPSHNTDNRVLDQAMREIGELAGVQCASAPVTDKKDGI